MPERVAMKPTRGAPFSIAITSSGDGDLREAARRLGHPHSAVAASGQKSPAKFFEVAERLKAAVS